MQHYLLFEETTAVTGQAKEGLPPHRTYQATVRGTGDVTATVVIEGSNNGQEYLTIATITLSGTTVATDGFTSVAPWHFVRARISVAPTGTGAKVSSTVGA